MTTTHTEQVEAKIGDRLAALTLIQSDHATYEKAVHEHALRTADENPLIVAQQLGEYLGHPVDVGTLCDLAEHLTTVEWNGYSGYSEGEFHRRRVESLTSGILAGPAVIR